MKKSSSETNITRGEWMAALAAASEPSRTAPAMPPSWRAFIRERVLTALAAKRARGERVGCEPFGYRVNGDGRTLHPFEPEQRALAVIRDCRDARYSLREIARELNGLGLMNRAGAPFGFENVRGILRTLDRRCEAVSK